jgi:hypothetical protein
MKTLITLLAISAAACGGRFQNDRDAAWCVEDVRLLDAAVSAAEEWEERSADSRTGQVHFSFYRPANGYDCSDADTRIVTSTDIAADSAGSMGPYPGYAELRVSPKVTEFGQMRALMLHEMGHFLVGGRHSKDERDIMYPKDVGVRHLTDRDVAMLDDYGAGWDQ